MWRWPAFPYEAWKVTDGFVALLRLKFRDLAKLVKLV